MQPYVKFLDQDYSGEPTNFTLYLPDIDATNFEAYRDINIPALQAAIMEITHLEWTSWDFVSEVHSDVGTFPANPYAQREQRAIFKCIDTVNGREFTIGVACPDLDDMAIPGTDVINMTNVDVAAYKTAVELWSLSPDGNAFSIVSGKVEGVNN